MQMPILITNQVNCVTGTLDLTLLANVQKDADDLVRPSEPDSKTDGTKDVEETVTVCKTLQELQQQLKFQKDLVAQKLQDAQKMQQVLQAQKLQGQEKTVAKVGPYL
jgi:molybdopterin converting factor small subunit